MSAATRRRAARLAREAAANRAWVTETSWFYNLDNHRPDKQVAAELDAILSTRPAALDLCETIGNHTGHRPGYAWLRNLDGNVRRSRLEARANVQSYVRADLNVTPHHARWIDLDGTWPRTDGPGLHPPRSFMLYQMGRMPNVVGHQAPRNAQGWQQLQREGIRAIADTFAVNPRGDAVDRWLQRTRPAKVAWDGNARAGDDPGPDTLADLIDGKVHGGIRIDHLITTGPIRVLDVEPVTRVAGVGLESDHVHAIRYTWQVRAFWLGGARA